MLLRVIEWGQVDHFGREELVDVDDDAFAYDGGGDGDDDGEEEGRSNHDHLLGDDDACVDDGDVGGDDDVDVGSIEDSNYLVVEGNLDGTFFFLPKKLFSLLMSFYFNM